MKKFFKRRYLALLVLVITGTALAAPINWSQIRQNSDIVLSQIGMEFTSDGTPAWVKVMQINTGGRVVVFWPLLDGLLNPYITGWALSWYSTWVSLWEYTGNVLKPTTTSQVNLAGGNFNAANGDYSVALGLANTANGKAAVAIGRWASAIADGSTALGGWGAEWFYSFAAGSNTKALNSYSIALWKDSQAVWYTSVAIWYEAIASWSQAVSIWHTTSASGDASTALWYFTNAVWFTSTAMWYKTNAAWMHSTTMWYYTNAWWDHSIAMWYNAGANGIRSISIWDNTKANGDNSIAMWFSSIAAGFNSTTMWYWTIANGDYSTAMWQLSIAQWNFSSAHGLSTQANRQAATTVGQYNSWNRSSLFQVGIGADDTNRRNGFEVTDLWNIFMNELTGYTCLATDADGMVIDVPCLTWYTETDPVFTANSGDYIPRTTTWYFYQELPSSYIEDDWWQLVFNWSSVSIKSTVWNSISITNEWWQLSADTWYFMFHDARDTKLWLTYFNDWSLAFSWFGNDFVTWSLIHKWYADERYIPRSSVDTGFNHTGSDTIIPSEKAVWEIFSWLTLWYVPVWDSLNFVNTNIIYTWGNLGIGTTTPTHALTVSGNINVTTWYNIYDWGGNPYVTGIVQYWQYVGSILSPNIVWMFWFELWSWAQASSNSAIAIWENARAYNTNPIAIWKNSSAGSNSIAIWENNTANYWGAVSVWYSNTSSGIASHTFWYGNSTFWIRSIAFWSTNALYGPYSIWVWEGLITNETWQIVFWKFNVWVTWSIMEFGMWEWGSDRKNIITILTGGFMGIGTSTPTQALTVSWAIGIDNWVNTPFRFAYSGGLMEWQYFTGGVRVSAFVYTLP